MENIWKRKKLNNNTKNVYWKQQRSTQYYMGVKPGHTTKRSEKNCWHLRCTVTKGSYVSVGQSKKQTVKYVKNSELKRICYKEPFRGNSVWPHMQDGGQQEVKDTDVRNCRQNE